MLCHCGSVIHKYGSAAESDQRYCSIAPSDSNSSQSDKTLSVTGIAQWVELKTRHNTDAGSSTLCGKRFLSSSFFLFFLSQSQLSVHTPSTVFWHLPPSSAGFGYATEGELFISAQPSTDAVSALRKVWVLIIL